MNYLEELDLPALSPQQEDGIARELAPLIPQLESLNQNAQSVAKLARESTAPGQMSIIEELYRWNKQKLEENNQMLHENIAKESGIKNSLKKVEAGGILRGSPEDLRNVQANLKEIHEQIINIVEEINFVAIRDIKGLSKNEGIPSFNKMWVWVLEVFYGYPASKFYWPEFKAKVFGKDKGEEFRRRIITHKYGEIGDTEKLELREIVDVHKNVIIDYIKSPDLTQFVNVIDLIEKYVTEYEQYETLRTKGVEDMDVQAVREEEDKVLKASARFNSVKYDVITEMQNILFLVNHEFRPKRDD